MVVSVTEQVAVLVMPVPVRFTALQLVSATFAALRNAKVPLGLVPVGPVTVAVKVNAALGAGALALVARLTVVGAALVMLILGLVPDEAA